MILTLNDAIEKYVIYIDGLFFSLIVPFKALANCQRSYWCINSVNDTDNACIACVIDTGEDMLRRRH
jgi:hypothetical protein